MRNSLHDSHWIAKTRWLTQALIISGALNIGLVSTFIYFVFKDKQATTTIQRSIKKPAAAQTTLTNLSLLHSYCLLPAQELFLRLEHAEPVEEGLTKRDLALGCLVAFHHFNLEKALGALPLQKRLLQYANRGGQEIIDIPVFPGLNTEQFRAILNYAKTEKWPLTPQGLFYELLRSAGSWDPSLIEAFSFSPEYEAVATLFAKTGIKLSSEQIISLIAEGPWSCLTNIQEFTEEKRRAFLVQYLNHRSKVAAQMLLHHDSDFICKKLDDTEILTLLDLCQEEKTPILQTLAKQLLTSLRTDTLRYKAAHILYTHAQEPMPEPFDYERAVERFSPPPVRVPEPVKVVAVAPPKPVILRTHLVETGDSLWKIAHKYGVSIEEIKQLNKLETDRLRPGKKLQIPDKK